MVKQDFLLIQTQKCVKPAYQYNQGDSMGVKKGLVWVFAGSAMV